MARRADVMSPSTLYARDDLRIDWHRVERGAGPAHLVVTFTERTFRDLSGPGFGTEFLRQSGFDVLSIKNRRDDWYASLDPGHLAGVVASVRSKGR